MQSPVAVRAYSFAAVFRVRELTTVFTEAGGEANQQQDEVDVVFPDGARAVAFDFGAIVFFGLDAKRRDSIITTIGKLLAGEPHPPLTEDFLVEIKPDAPAEARFDRVIVPELTGPVVSVVGLLLAQSAAMDYYAEDVREITLVTDAITRQLATRGQLKGPLKSLLKFIGRCIQTKNGIIETLALFDKPDITWEQESLDVLFVRLRKLLEIDDRFRALEYKLRMIQETLELIVDLSRSRQSFLLEAAVFVLILVEVMVMIWQVLEVRHP